MMDVQEDDHRSRTQALEAAILANPAQHQHDFDGLMACCTVDGVLVAWLMEVHERVSGRTNGGQRCDVTEGPCSCGAWH